MKYLRAAWVRRVLRNPTGHHYSIVFGDWVDELRYLAQIYGIQFVFNQ